MGLAVADLVVLLPVFRSLRAYYLVGSLFILRHLGILHLFDGLQHLPDKTAIFWLLKLMAPT